MRTQLNAGFTLMELVIVITVIGLLATLGYGGVTNMIVRSRDTRRVSDINEIIQAMEAFNADNGTYPGEADVNGVQLSQHCVSDLRTDLTNGNYLKTIGEDPRGANTPCGVASTVPLIDAAFFYGFDYTNAAGTCISINNLETQWGLDQLITKYGQAQSTNAGGQANIGTGSPMQFNYCF